MATDGLGLDELVSAWRIKVALNLQQSLDLRQELINFVEMQNDGPPTVKFYPNNNQKGGSGLQLYQPIVESWCIVGTWPEHGFIRIYLASCKAFSHEEVTGLLAKKFGTENILMDWQKPI